MVPPRLRDGGGGGDGSNGGSPPEMGKKVGVVVEEVGSVSSYGGRQ